MNINIPRRRARIYRLHELDEFVGYILEAVETPGAEYPNYYNGLQGVYAGKRGDKHFLLVDLYEDHLFMDLCGPCDEWTFKVIGPARIDVTLDETPAVQEKRHVSISVVQQFLENTKRAALEERL